jgi:hypothetical protein
MADRFEAELAAMTSKLAEKDAVIARLTYENQNQLTSRDFQYSETSVPANNPPLFKKSNSVMLVKREENLRVIEEDDEDLVVIATPESWKKKKRAAMRKFLHKSSPSMHVLDTLTADRKRVGDRSVNPPNTKLQADMVTLWSVDSESYAVLQQRSPSFSEMPKQLLSTLNVGSAPASVSPITGALPRIGAPAVLPAVTASASNANTNGNNISRYGGAVSEDGPTRRLKAVQRTRAFSLSTIQ